VHNSLKEKLIERLKQACADLKVGASFRFDTTVNPIITKEDQERLKKAAKEAGSEAIKYGGLVVVDRSHDDLPGYCVGPVVIELPYERAFQKDSFAQRELFGPVIHIIGFESLNEAVNLFNSTDYALTGGIFSQSQNDIDYLLTKLESGNLYINRTITGARVAIEPFGGFKLSGTGPKAGGRHYVLALHQIKDVALKPTHVIANEEGNDEWKSLARPSRLSVVSKKERIEKFLDTFIPTFESHYLGIYQNYKETLRDYRKWINKNFINFMEREHKNRVIPGQLSYNRYSLYAEHVLVLALTDRPDIKTLIQIFSAMNVGSGVSIVCRNKKTFQWWNNIRDVFIQSGFSKENISVHFIKTSELPKIVNQPRLSAIIFHGQMEDINEKLGKFLDDGKSDQRMRSILTVNDYLKTNDFYHQTLNFIWVRSMAVNTMRHGAPLDLEF